MAIFPWFLELRKSIYLERESCNMFYVEDAIKIMLQARMFMQHILNPTGVTYFDYFDFR